MELTILQYREHLTVYGVKYLKKKGISGISPDGQPRYKGKDSYISIVFLLSNCAKDCSSRIPKNKKCITNIPWDILEKTKGQALLSSFIKNPKQFLQNGKEEIANYLDEQLANPSKPFWEKLAKMQSTGISKSREEKLIQDLKMIESNVNTPKTVKESLIQARIGQGKYRRSLIQYWKECPITNCTIEEVLRASHIKPWKDSNDQERLDQFNGILLSPNIDLLFDKGLISFENDGTLIYTKSITIDNLKNLGIDTEAKVSNFCDKHLKYLKWHRENIFRT